MLESYTESERQRWLFLRAVEWNALPAFITQPLVPLLLIYFPWYQVLAAAFLLGVVWCGIRYFFMNPRLAHVAAFFVILRWPASVGSGAYLVFQHSYFPAVIALLWPLLAGRIGIPGKIGVTQVALARKLGYIE